MKSWMPRLTSPTWFSSPVAKYLQRSCPKCNGYLGIVVLERNVKMRRRSMDGA